MSSFRVGQKVVLVDASESRIGMPREEAEKLGANYPVEHVVYTVREIYLTRLSRTPCIVLHEIDNRHIDIGGREPGFEAKRFRPVLSKPTDISIFKAMLTPSRAKEHA
jgi:hypothetical protein